MDGTKTVKAPAALAPATPDRESSSTKQRSAPTARRADANRNTSGEGFPKLTSSRATIKSNLPPKPASSRHFNAFARWLLVAKQYGIPFCSNKARQLRTPRFTGIPLFQTYLYQNSLLSRVNSLHSNSSPKKTINLRRTSLLSRPERVSRKELETLKPMDFAACFHANQYPISVSRTSPSRSSITPSILTSPFEPKLEHPFATCADSKVAFTLDFPGPVGLFEKHKHLLLLTPASPQLHRTSPVAWAFFRKSFYLPP